MADLSAVLRYMAEVASADEEPRVDVGNVVWLSDTGPGHVVKLWPDELERAKPLLAADALHREEHLIWQGYLWIEGSLSGRRYRVPMVRRRV